MAQVKVKQKRSASQSLSLVGLTLDSPGVICPSGYYRLADAPEVGAAIWWICDMVASMTLQLMSNGDNGDSRIRDALARKVDISPYSLGTRQTLMSWITWMMLTEGNAYALPVTSGGRLEDIVPMPTARAQLKPDGTPYEIVYKGLAYSPDEVLHFPFRPDPERPWLGLGLRVPLQQVIDSISQTAATKLAYMSSEYKPPIIIAVNSDSDLGDEEKRDKILDAYIKRSDPRKPWVIPADLMRVSQVKPLSLNDLAIKDGIELDKKAVASIVGVPGYVVGAGTFNKEEHNTFVSTRLLYITDVIRQILTKGLLISDERYFRFNARSLYAYDLQELAGIGQDLYIRGLMTGNEVRNWLGLTPREGLDELVILENFIPASKIGDQKKLLQGGANE